MSPLASTAASLAVAFAAGVLIGAEREQAQSGSARGDFGGIRTFPLIALLGALGAAVQGVMGVWLLVVLGAGVVVLLATARFRAASDDDPGISTEVAALATFALGALAATPAILPEPPRFLLVASSAAVVMAMLALKKPLHGFIAKVSSADVYATVKFVLFALVVLPVLPQRTFGPFDVLNPFKIGLMVALVAGLSFVGYIAARVVGGGKGILITALVGGLVSSTAVTLALSGRARESSATSGLFAAAIGAACAVMFARVLLVVSAVDRPLLAPLAVPVGAGLAVAVVVVAIAYARARSRPGTTAAVPVRNPFELRQALGFGLLYAAVLFVTKAAAVLVGQRGLLVSAAVAGLSDVDVITLSMAELHRGGAPTSTAVLAIVLATGTNTLAKVAIAFVVGRGALGARVAVVLLPSAAVAGAVAAWTASR